MAHEERPTVPAGLAMHLDKRVEDALAGARFDLYRGRLAERSLLDEQIDVGHSLAESGRALPAASGEDQVDENLEVGPVKLLDHHPRGRNRGEPCLRGGQDDRLWHSVDTAQEVVGRLDAANGLPIGRNLLQP